MAAKRKKAPAAKAVYTYFVTYEDDDLFDSKEEAVEAAKQVAAQEERSVAVAVIVGRIVRSETYTVKDV